MKNPTNRIKEKEQFKSVAKDSSGKFAKTESLALSCRFCGSSNVVSDLHDWLYYGNKNDFMVCETKPQNGTSHCFRFATINIVENGRRFTLLALPMHAFDEKYKVLDELITYAKSKISIRNVYVDRGFFTVKCIDTLYQQKVKWLMPAIKNKAIQKLIKENTTPKILDYVMGDIRYQHVKFKLVIVNDQENVKRV